jgi:hypothetical protein
MLTNKDETSWKYDISAFIGENGGKNKCLKLCTSILVAHGLVYFDHSILYYVTTAWRITGTLQNVIGHLEVFKSLGSHACFRNSSSLNYLHVDNAFIDLKICS